MSQLSIVDTTSYQKSRWGPGVDKHRVEVCCERRKRIGECGVEGRTAGKQNSVAAWALPSFCGHQVLPTYSFSLQMNSIVAEMMILANSYVARRIYE